MQTLLFNTSTKTAKLYEGHQEKSQILYDLTDIPTVKAESNYYEVFRTSEDGKARPVLRLPISNTIMVLVH